MNSIKSLGLLAQQLIPWVIIGILVLITLHLKKRGDLKKAKYAEIVMYAFVIGLGAVSLVLIYALSQWK